MITRLFGPKMQSSTLAIRAISKSKGIEILDLKATSWPALKIEIPFTHNQLSHRNMLTSNTCYSHSSFRKLARKTKTIMFGTSLDRAISERNITASREMQALVKQKADSGDSDTK
jgi:hypothetical protein